MKGPILLYTIVVEEYTYREKPNSEGCYQTANSKVYPVPFLFNDLKSAKKYIERVFPNAGALHFMQYYDEQWATDNSRMVSSTSITIHDVVYDPDNLLKEN